MDSSNNISTATMKLMIPIFSSIYDVTTIDDFKMLLCVLFFLSTPNIISKNISIESRDGNDDDNNGGGGDGGDNDDRPTDRKKATHISVIHSTE